jgi:hypothetical protein
LLKAKVLPADLHDRPAAELVLAGLGDRFPGIRLLWADTAYRGLGDWLVGTLGWSPEITRHWWTGARVWVAAGQPPPERPAGFRVLPRRWIAIACTELPNRGSSGPRRSSGGGCACWAMTTAARG